MLPPVLVLQQLGQRLQYSLIDQPKYVVVAAAVAAVVVVVVVAVASAVEKEE